MQEQTEHLSLKETELAKDLDLDLNNYKMPLIEEYQWNKTLWIVGCVLTTLVMALVSGIAIRDMMQSGYNYVAHTSLAVNLIFSFGGMLGIYEWFIRK